MKILSVLVCPVPDRGHEQKTDVKHGKQTARTDVKILSVLVCPVPDRGHEQKTDVKHL